MPKSTLRHSSQQKIVNTQDIIDRLSLFSCSSYFKLFTILIKKSHYCTCFIIIHVRVCSQNGPHEIHLNTFMLGWPYLLHSLSCSNLQETKRLSLSPPTNFPIQNVIPKDTGSFKIFFPFGIPFHYVSFGDDSLKNHIHQIVKIPNTTQYQF